MKTDYLTRAEGPDFALDFAPDADDFAVLEIDGIERLSLRSLRIGKFSEEGALTRKCRLHNSNDSLSVSAELLRLVPFGSEYEVKRQFELADGFCRMSLDVDPGAGTVESLSLEPVSFSGPWEKLTLVTLQDGAAAVESHSLGEENSVWYDAAEPLIALVLEAADGLKLEFGCGSDLWRHRVALSEEGCRAVCRLSGNRELLTLERTPFAFAAEQQQARRSWRFKSYFAWSRSDAGKTAEKTERRALGALEIPATGSSGSGRPCLNSAPARRRLRTLIRGAQGDLELAEAAPELCVDAAHQDRPGRGELLHWDLDDYFELYLWGNRQLQRRGGALTFTPLAGHWSGVLASIAVLGRIPRSGIVSEE